MNAFSIRKANHQDAARIRRLVVRGRINPIGLDWRRFIVAVDTSGHVIGCVQLKPHGDGSVELASLAVDEDWRRQGVGALLVEVVITIHSGNLFLMCRAGLGIFYEKFGFKALSVDQMPAYFQRVNRWMTWLGRLRPESEGLLIMWRDCGVPGVDQYPHLVG